MSESSSEIIFFSSTKFLIGCALASIAFLFIGNTISIPVWFIGAEVFTTILLLFILGSAKYQLNKNALTYGSVMIVAASSWGIWWERSSLKLAFQEKNSSEIWNFIHHHFLTLHGLDDLIHADTMLFILGLTLFVCVIAQTRLLESISFSVLKKNKGDVVPTVAILTGIVAFSSGILDGVSMIGLMIRTLVIILFLAKAEDAAVIFAVVVSTIITTVCGMWLAYGEPPNLIMKANLHPHLTNAFFLRYCLPVAIGSYFIVLFNLRRFLKGRRVEIEKLDVLDLNTADVRFLQASKHGEVLTPIEFIEEHKSLLGSQLEPVIKRLHHGESLGQALVSEKVEPSIRKTILGSFVSENLASSLDEHYVSLNSGDGPQGLSRINEALSEVRKQRIKSQWIGALSFIPFIGFLISHAVNHEISLMWASFSGFAIALIGIFHIPKMRKLALTEAKHEYTEYLFLFPLFLSITLLQKTGFFEQLAVMLHKGIDLLGVAHIAFVQFTGACFLSALLDNNVVADFASRALHGLDVGVIHLFSMAQIAGYAAGGCWTHIGSAQSVVAFAFIKKEVDEHYTPFQWIKMMTPIILEIFLLMTIVIYGEAHLMAFLEG